MIRIRCGGIFLLQARIVDDLHPQQHFSFFINTQHATGIDRATSSVVGVVAEGKVHDGLLSELHPEHELR